MSDPYVLVTGASGFVGRAVVRRLLERREHKPWRDVRALARTAEAQGKVQALGATVVRGDLLSDSDDAWRAVAERAEWIVHCAQPASREAAERARMDLRVLAAMGAARTVLVLGSSYFGRTVPGEIADETMSPRRPLGIGPTFEAGVAAMHEANARGADAVAAYVGAVYGRGSWFVRLYRHAILAGDPVAVHDPPPRWPFVAIDDCARAIEHLLVAPRAELDRVGRDVIVAAGAPTPMDEFVVAIGERLGKAARVERLDEGAFAARYASSPLVAEYLAADMAHSDARLRALGFSPTHATVRDGLAALLPSAP